MEGVAWGGLVTLAGEGSIILGAWRRREGGVQTQPALLTKWSLTLPDSCALNPSGIWEKPSVLKAPSQGADMDSSCFGKGSERAGHAQPLPAYVAG